MPAGSRDELASISYWRQSEDLIAQRFYVAFCLAVSSIQDSLIAEDLKQSGNLNWSATCSYYSMVHAGRLFCFLSLGDYPKGHDKLRKVLAGPPLVPTPQTADSSDLPFDWLASFVPTGHDLHYGSTTGRGADVRNRQRIEDYLEDIGVNDALMRFRAFGVLLKSCGDLRNDSNYEALLIAHEYKHVVVSQAFEDLARDALIGSIYAVDLALDAFNGYRQNDPDLAAPVHSFDSLLSEYAHERIGNGIRRKLSGSKAALGRLEAILTRLTPQGGRYSNVELEQQISMQLFAGKASLMSEFRAKVDRLGQSVNALP